MGWNPFIEDLETREDNQVVVEERIAQLAHEMTDLAKQLELFESDDFSWFLGYLDAFKNRVKDEAISIDDPIKHAEKRAEYRLLAFLLALPRTTSLAYQTRKDELETLRPDTGTLND